MNGDAPAARHIPDNTIVRQRVAALGKTHQDVIEPLDFDPLFAFARRLLHDRLILLLVRLQDLGRQQAVDHLIG